MPMMSPISPQMSMSMSMSKSMFMLSDYSLISLGEIQDPNCPTFHDRDDPTSNLLNMVLPGFHNLPFTIVFTMIGMVVGTVAVLVVILVTVGGSHKSKSSQ